MTNERYGLVRELKGTLQAEVSLVLIQSDQAEPQTWKAPTLTTWQVEEETLTKTGSAADFGQY
jgi:hypothetical protein